MDDHEGHSPPPFLRCLLAIPARKKQEEEQVELLQAAPSEAILHAHALSHAMLAATLPEPLEAIQGLGLRVLTWVLRLSAEIVFLLASCCSRSSFHAGFGGKPFHTRDR